MQEGIHGCHRLGEPQCEGPQITRGVDRRLRRAIEAARASVRGDLKMTGARAAALAAHAPHAANYAIKALSIAPANEDRDTVIATEHEWQYQQLAEHLRELLRKS